MTTDPLFLILVVVGVALLFDFSNGWNDAANAIATVVSTRVLSPLQAISMAAVMNFIGAFMGTHVAKTIGTSMAEPEYITLVVVLAAMGSAFLWNAAMTFMGLPVSASHALIGGIVGALTMSSGIQALKLGGLAKIFTALLISPILGFIIGLILMWLINVIFHSRNPASISKHFGRLQLVSAAFMALSHGTNDAQKVMGVITMALLAGGFITTFQVPVWVIIAAGSAIALGTAIGGWRVIKTLGVGMYHMRPVHGFAAETSASAVILGASGLGLPVSTTHVITSCILGVGATRRLSAVRWGVVGKIMVAWIFTLPATAIMAALLYAVGAKIFPS
jgi:PiT family inorganic phosphate transporter